MKNYLRKIKNKFAWSTQYAQDQSQEIHHIKDNFKLTVVLTQFKRANLEKQLIAINKQSRKPDQIIVFQNGDFVNIDHLCEKYNFDLVKSSINTKFFGRFAYCLALESDYFIVMDDDIIPGDLCFETYLNESIRLNAIIGGNGRIAISNNFYDNLQHPSDVGVRMQTVLVDFVGHLWLFKRDWLYDMFSIKPVTLNTGEDMHLCFSAKLKSGIKSYVGMQRNINEMSDITNNKLASDRHSSFKVTPKKERVSVEIYFKELGINFIAKN